MSNVRLWDREEDRPFTLAGREVDPSLRTVASAGGVTPVEPRIMALLLMLVRHAGQVVRRADLIDAIWGGAAGSDQSLTSAISALRKALGETKDDRVILTVPKIGYRLVAEPFYTARGEEPRRHRFAGPSRRALAMPAAIAATLLTVLVLVGALAPRLQADAFDTVVVAPVLTDPGLRAEGFVLGLEVAETLSRLEGYRVIGPFDASRVDVSGLKPDLLISSELTRDDDGVRVLMTLNDPASGDSPRRIQITASDFLGLRTEYLSALLGLFPTPDELPPPRMTDDAEAYGAYVLGSFHYWQLTADGHEAAVRHLERAVARDPDFAAAQLMLANGHLARAASTPGEPGGDVRAEARRALLASVRADPTNPVALATLGDVQLCYDADPEAARQSFEAALALDPDVNHQGVFRYHIARGDHAAAHDFLRKSIREYPLSPWQHAVVAMNMLMLGQWEEAMALAERAIELEPGLWKARQARAMVRSRLGDAVAASEEVLTLLDDQPDNPSLLVSAAIIMMESGEEAGARDMITRLRQSTDRAIFLAFADLHGGAKRSALDHLGSAAKEGDLSMCYLAVQPLWDPLRAEPEFQALERSYRIGPPGTGVRQSSLMTGSGGR